MKAQTATPCTITNLHEVEPRAAVEALVLPWPAYPGHPGGLAAEVETEDGSRLLVSRLEGEERWVVDGLYAPGSSAPVFLNGEGSRCTMLHTAPEEVGEELDALAALVGQARALGVDVELARADLDALRETVDALLDLPDEQLPAAVARANRGEPARLSAAWSEEPPSVTEVLGGLSARIIDAIEAEGAAVDLVKTFKMADGSGRWATLARLAAFGQEYGIRISAPAPPDAPAWARERHGGYEVVRLAGDQLD